MGHGRAQWLLIGLALAFLAVVLASTGARPAASAAILIQATDRPALQATPVPQPTPTPVEGPDLTVTFFDSPDPVPSGTDLTYSLLVANAGGTFSLGTTVFVSLPSGTVASTLGPNCSLAGGGVTCTVPPLSPGGTAGFTFSLNVTAGPGNIINAVAIVDPANLTQESDKSNNTATTTTFVGPALVGPTATPTPTVVAVLPTATPVVIVVTSTPAPREPTPLPPPPPPPPPPVSELWLLVLDATQTYTVTDEPAWIAQPGEWYRVIMQEADWALAHWEGDPPEVAVWIQLDGRVQLTQA
jgi:hypothetical protein